MKFRLFHLLVALALTLGTHHGYLALMHSEQNAPIIVYPYKTALLPPDEQHRLAEGIPIQTAGQLDALLMEYLS